MIVGGIPKCANFVVNQLQIKSKCIMMKKFLFISLLFAAFLISPNNLMANGGHPGYPHDNPYHHHDPGNHPGNGCDPGDKPNVGAPLDGGLISILLGGVGVAYLNRKRKKNKAIQ